jgi:hypothetical protein
VYIIGLYCAILQTITTAIPGLARVAKAAGASHITREGIGPTEWLCRFGRAVNLAVNGHPEEPLPLQGPLGFSYR